MKRISSVYFKFFQLHERRAVKLLIACFFFISVFSKLSVGTDYFLIAISSVINLLVLFLLVQNLEILINKKSTLFLLFSPAFIIIHSIYDQKIYILWDLFYLSVTFLFIKFKNRENDNLNHLISLITFSICLIIDFRSVFLSPLIIYGVLRHHYVGVSNKWFTTLCLITFVGAIAYYRDTFHAPNLSFADYFFIGLNLFIAITPLFLFGFIWRNRAVASLCILGLVPMAFLGLPIYFLIYCFISTLTIASLLNFPKGKCICEEKSSSLGVVLLGAVLWALPLNDSNHFRAGLFAEIIGQWSGAPTQDPLGHPFWHRVGKQYSAAIVGDFFPAQKRLSRDDFIFFFKRTSNIQKVEYKNTHNWKSLGMAQLNVGTVYILDDWASNPELVIFFDPRRDMLATIDGYDVFVPGWVSCRDGCPEVTKGLPLDWQIYKSWPEVDGGLLIERIPPEFNSDGKVFFHDSGNGLPMLLGGWSWPERWGVWTDSRNAGLLVPYKDHKKKRLVLDARALINGRHPSQRVEIFLNGEFQKTVELTKEEKNLLNIDLSKIPVSSKFFTVELKVHSPRSPKELGIGNDPRRLGVGLVSAQFE